MIRPVRTQLGFVPAFLFLSLAAGACATQPAAPSVTPPPSLPAPAPPPEHHHELNLPPVGAQVSVGLDGKDRDVPLAELASSDATAPLLALWKRAFPAEDPTALHFDLFGSDGFHPASRPACARLLTAAEVGTARIDLVTHNVTFTDGTNLPGCYRVKAVVRMEAIR